MRHFARERRAKRNQDSRRRDAGYNGNKAKDNGRRPAHQDDAKALVTIDGEDIDWSGHVEEDAQNYAVMAYSSSNSGSDNEVKSCSKTCEESYTRLKKLYDEERDKLGDASVEITAYTLALKKEYESDSDNDSVYNVQENKEKPSFAFTDSVKHVKPSRENVKETSTPNHSPKIEKQDRNATLVKGRLLEVTTVKHRSLVEFEVILLEYRIFKCWFSHQTSNGYQFTMFTPHQELASPGANGSCKELDSPKQTVLGKDTSNPLIIDSLLKTIWLSMHHVIAMKHLLFQSKRLLEIFIELARMGYEKPPPKLTFYKAFFSAQWKFLIHILVQCINAKRTAWNEFSCSMASVVICLATGRKINFSKYIFDSMYTSHALTQKVFANMCRVCKGFSGVETPLFATMLVQPQAEVEEDEVAVAALEQDKIAQALEIFKLKRRVKKLDKKRRSKSLGLKRLRKGRKDDDTAAIKVASVAEPTVFDDEEVTMTMSQTLIKMKAEKARLLDEQMAKRLHNKEVKQAAAREKQEKMTWKRLKCYKSSMKTNKKTLTEILKKMIVYLKNMAGYKMEHFKGMTHDKVRPIFEREYNKVQTLFKPDKDVDEEPTKKRVAGETLLQESFKKLKAVEVSGSHSTQDTPTDDPKEMSKEDVKNMLEIVPVSEFKVKALQVKYPLID
uniref:Glutamic acid-rich protein-like n=1 Tax=Tanacetum cinerariifolium TaxID=118510 RepID=A0A699ICS5_TANCI|nr:hypothetical protein [Tanacetum cinerariifolium]